MGFLRDLVMARPLLWEEAGGSMKTTQMKTIGLALAAMVIPNAAGCDSAAFAKKKTDRVTKVTPKKKASIPVTKLKPMAELMKEDNESSDAKSTEDTLEHKALASIGTAMDPVIIKGEFDALDELANYEPELIAANGMKLKRLVTSSGIDSREPSTSASIFPVEEEKVYAFMEVENTTDEELALQVVFVSPKGDTTGHVTVNVPANSPRWRTWAYTRYANTVGQWAAEVRLEDGTVIGKLVFDVDVCC